MSAYLITGSPGVGKTATLQELTARGYITYGDEPNVTASLYDRQTGRFMRGYPPIPFDHDRYVWNWDIPALTKILTASPDPTFVGGICANTTATFHLYQAVFVLLPSLENLKQRILTRAGNHYGKHPDELAHVIKTFDATGDLWRQEGAVIIDANRPVAEITDDILNRVKNKATA